MIDKVYEGSMGNISKESAPYLLERNIKRAERNPEKFYFSRDSRLKYCMLMAHPENIAIYCGTSLKIPFLFLSSPHSVLYGKVPYFDRFIDACGKNSNFQYAIVDSDSHYFHLNEPEKISQVVGNFMVKHLSIRHHL